MIFGMGSPGPVVGDTTNEDPIGLINKVLCGSSMC